MRNNFIDMLSTVKTPKIENNFKITKNIIIKQPTNKFDEIVENLKESITQTKISSESTC